MRKWQSKHHWASGCCVWTPPLVACTLINLDKQELKYQTTAKKCYDSSVDRNHVQTSSPVNFRDNNIIPDLLKKNLLPCENINWQKTDLQLMWMNEETLLRYGSHQNKGQKLNMSSNDDAKDKYGFPLALVWPLQYGNDIVVSLKRSRKTRKKKKKKKRVWYTSHRCVL